MDYRLKKKIFILLTLILILPLLFSCQKKGDKIKDYINKQEFIKAEDLISRGNFSDIEKKGLSDLLFTKKLEVIKQAAYDSDWSNVTDIIKTSSFSEKQFDAILTGLYKSCPDIEKIYVNTEFSIPVTSKCENSNILQLAINEKNGDFLSQMMNEKSLEKIFLSKQFIQDLLNFNHAESLDVYFSNKQYHDFFLTLPESLELICFYPSLFDYFSKNEFMMIHSYNLDSKYFPIALDTLNVKAVKLLIDLSVPMTKSDYDYYLYFITSSFTNGDVQWYGIETEEYEEIVSMKDEIEKYFYQQK